MLWIGVKTRSPIILIIFVMIILAFMDDVFMFHEGIGLQLSQTLNLSGSVDGEGIRGRDIGEVIYILSVGLFFLGLGAIFYFREKSSWCRDTVHGVALVMVALVFFSVGMDTADHLLKSTHWRHLFGLADDFGEMLGLSAFLAFCIDRLRSYFVLAKNKLL